MGQNGHGGIGARGSQGVLVKFTSHSLLLQSYLSLTFILSRTCITPHLNWDCSKGYRLLCQMLRFMGCVPPEACYFGAFPYCM